MSVDLDEETFADLRIATQDWRRVRGQIGEAAAHERQALLDWIADARLAQADADARLAQADAEIAHPGTIAPADLPPFAERYIPVNSGEAAIYTPGYLRRRDPTAILYL